MSWQAFVDTNLVGSGHLLQAAIFGHDKNVWAKSNERFQVSKKMLIKTILFLPLNSSD